MSVPDNLRSTHSEKTKNAMKAPRSVKRITFNPSEANPGETLYVYVPKLNKNEVLRFDIDLSGGHANNFPVQNVSRAWWYEGIQSQDLSKIRSGAGDAKTTGVDAKKKLNEVYGKKYRINLDHQILTDHGIFYPQALYADLVFEVTLTPESQVVKGSDLTKLKYKLTNIQLEYEMIHSENLAEEAAGIYASGKEFAYDYVSRAKVVSIDKGTETRINIKVNTQRRSMKGILLLFVEPYAAGTRDMLYKNGIESRDIWSEVSRFFMKEKYKPQHITLEKFYTENKFGLLIDLRSMASQEMHRSGTRLVNSTDGVQLEIERDGKGSGQVNCHVFVISDSQFNIVDRQLQSVQF